jgi:hypothetical protein
MESSGVLPPGWYPDQQERGKERYWDGSQWTHQLRASRAAVPKPPPAPEAAGRPSAGPPRPARTPTPPKPGSWWSRFPTPAKWSIGVIALLFVIAAISGRGQQQTDSEDAKPAERPTVNVTVDQDGRGVRAKAITLTGTVDPPGASVLVFGNRKAKVTGGRWSLRIPLVYGVNDVPISATSAGHDPTDISATITREKTAEERAADKQKFINAAETIDYDQLHKNADRYAGRKVKYQGQIFQIQEDPVGGGLLLLSVTNEGYDLWTDNIWVNYKGNIKSAEDDIITIYGVVKGSRSYETQIGGETYVPEIDARYVEE